PKDIRQHELNQEVNRRQAVITDWYY
uniref:DUF3563 domain-containing protein n=1 Tax=Caenorhabditis tropicalis TaxID=1561998 RepID=A0A1I7T8Y6_9PELO